MQSCCPASVRPSGIPVKYFANASLVIRGGEGRDILHKIGRGDDRSASTCPKGRLRSLLEGGLGPDRLSGRASDDVLMGGPLTGAAMNPARAFGPQLIFNSWSDGWIYYVGPAIGAVVAAVGYDWLYLRPGRPSVVGTAESGVAEPRPGDTALS